MRYRVIAIDLDGTLLRNDGSPSDASLDALRRAMEAGAIVVPCTGRMWHRARHAALSRLDGLRTGVFCNGAAVHRIACGTMEESTPLPLGFVPQVVDALQSLPVGYQICHIDGRGYGYQITRSPLRDLVLERWHNPPEPGVTFHPRIDLCDERPGHAAGPVLAMRVFMGDRQTYQDVVRRVQGFVAEAFCTCYCEPDSRLYHIEFCSRQVDKWAALRQIAAAAGVSPAETAAIGDQVNDITMIREAGCGIAMNNAHDEVRRVAKRVTRSNEEDGVAYAIDQMLAGEW